ncbi:MAG: restriction endonuclease subunit S [Bacilli bacterium]
MSFPRYSEYKDSGVEWLGEVPEHWDVVPLKGLAEFINGDAFNPTEWSEAGLPIIRIQNLNGGEEFNYYEGKTQERYLVRPGDLLFGWSGNRGTSFGPFIWNRSGLYVLNQHIFRVKPRRENSICLYWMLKAVTAHVEEQAHGIIGMVHITKGDLGAIRVPFPLVSEQHAVAAFLDRETAQIDALVTEQERLIVLLKEKRQAVISHAVTKGLDPTVPMKDSGIKWLGEVPEHWTINKVKRCASIRYGIGEPPSYQDEGVPLIRATNVNSGHITPEGLVLVDPRDIPENRIVWLEPGDIIVVRSGAYTGDSAIIREEHCPCIAGFDMVVHTIDCLPDFLQYALLSSYLKAGQIDIEKQRAAQPHLNAEELRSCLLILPPADEQEEITLFLNQETDRLDALVQIADRAIVLLKERRTALISAAVTGKIDVRGLVMEEVMA